MIYSEARSLLSPALVSALVRTRYTTKFTAAFKRRPGAEASPAATFPAIMQPKIVYPATINNNERTLPQYFWNLIKIKGMILLMINVGIAQIGKPVNISAIIEPIPPARHPTTGPKKKLVIKITLSPRCAYPSGIGIWINIVARHVSAIQIAVIHSCLIVNFFFIISSA